MGTQFPTAFVAVTSTILFWICFALLFWTYFGYPVLMYVWYKFNRMPIKRAEAGEYSPSLTLLIPAYNEADVIRRKLENSVSLEYPTNKLQILVIDDGSDDGTADIVREFATRGVTLIQQSQRGGKVAAINRGVEAATGEFIVLSDASPSYDQHALPLLIRRFIDPTVGVVVGKLALWDAATAVAKPAGLYWRYEAALRTWESETGSTVAVHGNMFAFRRSLYHGLKVGTVNDEFTIAMESIRQHHRVVYEPEAISYDDASSRMADEFKRRARINAGRYQALFSAGYLSAPNPGITFRLFSHKLLRPLSPMLMLGMLIANVVAVFASEPGYGFSLIPLSNTIAILLLAGQIAFYLMAFVGWFAERAGKHNRILNVVYFFVSSQFSALVGFWRWLRGTQRVTWQKRLAGTGINDPKMNPELAAANQGGQGESRS
jgi:cellulose synthase/poly-beta-1,6-N-acetylglucosamine synthase-like glycosyltransferase